MHVAHAIVGHAVLSVIMVSVLVLLVLAVFRLDRTLHAGRRLGDPLDPELVRRWNAHAV